MQTQPISVIVDRKVLPGKCSEFEKLLKGIIQASSQCEGYLGSSVTKPKTEGDNYYQVIFRYDCEKNLNAWIHSKERSKWIKKIDELIEEPSELQFITGLETWFALPAEKKITPPPRYKMAIVTWIAITPLLMAYNYIFGPLLKDLPLVPRFLISTPWIVLIMTYLWMPFIVKLFKRWLYPDRDS